MDTSWTELYLHLFFKDGFVYDRIPEARLDLVKYFNYGANIRRLIINIQNYHHWFAISEMKVAYSYI